MFIVYKKGDIRNQIVAWGADKERRLEGGHFDMFQTPLIFLLLQSSKLFLWWRTQSIHQNNVDLRIAIKMIVRRRMKTIVRQGCGQQQMDGAARMFVTEIKAMIRIQTLISICRNYSSLVDDGLMVSFLQYSGY